MEKGSLNHGSHWSLFSYQDFFPSILAYLQNVLIRDTDKDYERGDVCL